MSIAIVGAGSVGLSLSSLNPLGASIAYSLLSNKIGSAIILVDIDQARCEGEVLDLKDGAEDHHVVSGSFKDAGECDIICITAGAKQKSGESRTDLLTRNLAILGSILESMQPINQTAILIIIANPCDVLTHVARTLSGLPKNQVSSGALTGRLSDPERF
jgi:L-lactate dehydrogenase